MRSKRGSRDRSSSSRAPPERSDCVRSMLARRLRGQIASLGVDGQLGPDAGRHSRCMVAPGTCLPLTCAEPAPDACRRPWTPAQPVPARSPGPLRVLICMDRLSAWPSTGAPALQRLPRGRAPGARSASGSPMPHACMWRLRPDAGSGGSPRPVSGSREEGAASRRGLAARPRCAASLRGLAARPRGAASLRPPHPAGHRAARPRCATTRRAATGYHASRAVPPRGPRLPRPAGCSAARARPPRAAPGGLATRFRRAPPATPRSSSRRRRGQPRSS